MMDSKQRHFMLLTTAKYGGSFYKALAKAALLADAENLAKILSAFRDIEVLYGPRSPLYSEDL